MRAKNEELLYLLLWSCDKLARPTFRNLNESFESWAYRKGLLRELARLERRQLLESQGGPLDERVHRLTEQGRLLALGGRDVEACWSRAWDGYWRLVVFDVPVGQNGTRKQLVRYLRGNRFGCLQNSVWITPDPVNQEREILKGTRIDVETLIMLEARPCAGETDEQIVRAAWNFNLINDRYAEYLKVVKSRPEGTLESDAAAQNFRSWTAQERAAWRAAISLDPLLPKRLLPSDYLGCKAWRARLSAFALAAGQIRTFTNRKSAAKSLSHLGQ